MNYGGFMFSAGFLACLIVVFISALVTRRMSGTRSALTPLDRQHIERTEETKRKEHP